MKLRVALFLIVVCLSVILFSCRRNQPTLIDYNRPPDTELWYAPLDSSEYEWDVHMYWRGVDTDGVAQSYIWTITDTLEANVDLRWNPAERIVDFRTGRVTARTDSVIAFTAFTNVAGVGLRKNRQAFHIAAIDDNGVIDPTPAVIEFVATVGQLPQMRFNVTITTVDPETGDRTKVTKPYNPAVLDTLGMFRPLGITYRGSTTNGALLAYKFFPLTANVLVPGQDIWNEDLTDTSRYFPNRGADLLPTGVFRFVAQCRDESGAESRADVKGFTEGVVQVVVNFEPDTEIYQVENTYFIGGQAVREFVNFEDNVPDTVPYYSWLRIDYRGWDDKRDSLLCADDVNRCIRYQLQYERTSARVSGSNSRTRWIPEDAADTNPNGTPDSTTIDIGSFEYKIRARALDEQGKADGTMTDPLTGRVKSEIQIIGNYDPTLDDTFVLNYDGVVASADVDTITWDWWHPANFTGNPDDTLETDPETQKVYAKRTFYLDLQATGHDHPKEAERFGVLQWIWTLLRTDNSESEPLFSEGQDAWLDGTIPNAFDRRFEITYRYEIATDPGGSSIWADPPSFWNTDYRVTVQGRDIASNTEFSEYIFINGSRVLLNAYQATPLGRWTETGQFRFFLKVAR